MLGLSRVTRRRHARSVAALAAAVAIVGGGGARAEILATATSTAATASSGESPGLVPLTDSGATALAFSTTAPKQKVVITYNAECSVVPSTAGSSLSVAILVDGEPTNPVSGTDFALCSSTGAESGNDILTGLARQSVAAPAKAGAHFVTVFAQGVGTRGWTLDDSSLVVKK